MTKKRCTKCNEEKLLRDFRKDSRRSDNRQSACKVCMRSLQRSSYMVRYGPKVRTRNNQRALEMRARVAQYKAERGCSLCSERVLQCLDFHHLDPDEKDFQMSRVSTQSWERILKEINKCILVCKNCHTKIHSGLIMPHQ